MGEQSEDTFLMKLRNLFIIKHLLESDYNRHLISMWFRLIMCFILCFYIFLCFNRYTDYMVHTGNIGRSSTEAYFQEIERKNEYINLYGFSQRVFGKRQIEGFTIYKNEYDKLVSPRKRLDVTNIQNKVAEVKPIWDWLNANHIPFLYVEPPLPIADEEDLPFGVHDNTHQNAKQLHEELKGFQTIDLAVSSAISKEEQFYRTDHHWSGDTVFEAYQSILGWMIEQGVLHEETIDAIDFDRETADHFLGSYGVKVGKYYDGEDQYVYFLPKTDMRFTCINLTADEELIAEHEGSWYEAMMDASMLDNPEYNNKHAASIWGNNGENRIINHSVDEGKLLIISHSYGRPLAQYLALNFHEVRQIDPQKGRFNGNYLTYIDQYRPDVVLFLIEFEGEIIGEYRTSDRG